MKHLRKTAGFMNRVYGFWDGTLRQSNSIRLENRTIFSITTGRILIAMITTLVFIISIFSLLRCLCSIECGLLHQASPNTGSRNTSVLRVNASQATFIDSSLDTFNQCHSRHSFYSGAGKQKVCDSFDTGRGMMYMSIPSQLPAVKGCCSIFNAKFLE